MLYQANGQPIPPKKWREFLNGRTPTLDLAIEYLEGDPVDWQNTLVDALRYMNRRLADLDAIADDIEFFAYPDDELRDREIF